MFQWRLKLHEAKRALAAGRYDEACRVLGDAKLREFLPAKQLASEVAAKITDRARGKIARGQSAAGLADLRLAEDLGGEAEAADAIRQGYLDEAIRQAVVQLVAGEPAGVLRRLDQVHRRGMETEALRGLREIARQWANVAQQAEKGEMPAAQATLARVVRLVTALPAHLDTIELTAVLDRETAELAQRAASHHEARQRLHEASAKKQWAAALTALEEVVRQAPKDTVALSLRKRIWNQMGLNLTRSYRPARGASAEVVVQSDKKQDDMPPKDPDFDGRRTQRWTYARQIGKGLRESTQANRAEKKDTSMGKKQPDRRMVWVDSVGGFLVCLDDEIVLGQPAGGSSPDVPILADLSRRHAILRREAGSYVLHPLSMVRIDDREVTNPTVLSGDCTIQLGERVQLRFEKPHALSATARLTLLSSHRTAPSADAVLLMADSCVLGPESHCHIRCRDWKDDLILYRQADQVCCRSKQLLEINGEPQTEAAVLSDKMRIEGQDFALCVEYA